MSKVATIAVVTIGLVVVGLAAGTAGLVLAAGVAAVLAAVALTLAPDAWLARRLQGGWSRDDTRDW